MKKNLKTFAAAFALILVFSVQFYGQNKNDVGKSFYTSDEVRQMCGVPVDTVKMKEAFVRQDSMYKEYLKNKQSTKSKLFKVETIPNWQGMMSDVENQGGCGDCWVHAATGITEGQISILYGSRLSVDLDELEISGACNGGWPTQAESFIQNYKMRSEAGSYPNLQGVRWGIASKRGISGIDTIRNNLVNGPVAASFSVYQDFDDFFNDPYNKTGVYHHSYGGFLGNHAVVIVSYDDNNSYWLCKNSWGSAWGDNGYFRIGYGQCLIESMENSVVTVNQNCYAKIVPNLIPSLTSYGFVNSEWAYVYANQAVNNGQTLTIPSGSSVIFQPNISLTINGTLNATSATFDWNGSSNWGGITFNSGSSGSLSYCNIKHGSPGVKCNGVLPSISHCTFNVNSMALWLNSVGSPSTHISGNSFYNQNAQGQAISCYYSSPQIDGGT